VFPMLKIEKVLGKEKQVKISWFPLKKNQEDERSHLKFVLVKKDRDGMNIMSSFEKQLELPSHSMKYAGIKDKRGKTFQFVTLKGAREERIRSVAKLLRNVEVGNFETTDTDLDFRELWGNRFKIRIRDVNCEASEIENILRSIEQNGFINYFGTQRFGYTVGKYNQEIGLALMQHDFRRAFDLYIEPLDGDTRKFEIAKHLWMKNRDPKECFDALPLYDVVFRRAFQTIMDHGDTDETYRLIWEKIPAAKILLSQVSSLIWNEMITCRIDDDSFRIRSGDMISQGDSNTSYKVLQGKNLDNSFSDLVLPTPGTQWVDDPYVNDLLGPFLEKLGLRMADFDVKPIGQCATGILRPLIAFPHDFRYTVFGNDVNLRFSLRPGQYATCMLRELLQHEEISNVMHSSKNAF